MYIHGIVLLEICAMEKYKARKVDKCHSAFRNMWDEKI